MTHFLAKAEDQTDSPLIQIEIMSLIATDWFVYLCLNKKTHHHKISHVCAFLSSYMSIRAYRVSRQAVTIAHLIFI